MKKRERKEFNGKAQWRSLDDLADKPEFKQWLHREFPPGGSEMNNDWSRRNFLTLMGASMALAGLAGCRRPEQKIVPYVKPPEEIIPGIPQYYATTMPFGTGAYGLIVESHEGRPTKIEGNPSHPSTRGASNAWIQGSILGLYDPDRSRNVINNGVQKSWDDFVAFWQESAPEYAENRGEGLAILSESYSSITISRLRKEFEKVYPKARWVVYDPVSDENIFEGVKAASGENIRPVYNLNEASVILSIDSDFTLTESDSIANSRGFVDGRRMDSENDSMNRLYVVEANFSPTGAIADHRLRLQHSQMAAFAVELARQLKKAGLSLPEIPAASKLSSAAAGWVEVVAEDLVKAGRNAVVLAGHRQPAAIHALVYAINRALGNEGSTVSYHEMPDVAYSRLSDLKALSDDIKNGKITSLVMLGGNPAYNAPVDLEFGELLQKVEHRIHLSPYVDETSRNCTWHIPQTYYLEEWSDARAANGTASIVQPLIAPLFDGKSAVEVLNLLARGTNQPGYDGVRDTWQGRLSKTNFEKAWQKLLHDGVEANSGAKKVSPGLKAVAVSDALRSLIGAQNGASDELEIVFHVSPSLYDGRFANNGWLQELPDSMTKISWDNVARVSKKTADKLGAANGDLVRLTYHDRELEIPIWIVPGLADSTVMLELGYGRKDTGKVAGGVGFNTYLLRTSNHLHGGPGVNVLRTGTRHVLANTQDHGSMEGRPHVREATLTEYRKHPEFAPEAVHHPPLVSMWKDHKSDKGYQWGMAIDLTACTGCNACTIACQSENNIPIVGKEQVHKGREMHWIRVDRYFTGEVDQPDAVHQPVALSAL